MTKRILMTALAAALLLVGGAVAQEAGPYVWVNFIKAQPGQGENLVKMMIEQDEKIFSPLVDSGKALEWGIAMPIIHDGGDPASHVEWITFADWSGADAFFQAFMAGQKEKSPEQMKSEMEQWEAAVVPGSHADAVHYSVDIGEGTGARPGYIMLSDYKAKFGKSGEASKMWKEMAKPVYDGLIEDGSIINYGLLVPEIHRGQPYTHLSWYAAPALAARDAVSKAFQEAEAARSEEENKGVMERYLEIFDEGGHSDQILMVVHHYNGMGGAESE